MTTFPHRLAIMAPKNMTYTQIYDQRELGVQRDKVIQKKSKKTATSKGYRAQSITTK